VHRLQFFELIQDGAGCLGVVAVPFQFRQDLALASNVLAAGRDMLVGLPRRLSISRSKTGFWDKLLPLPHPQPAALPVPAHTFEVTDAAVRGAEYRGRPRAVNPSALFAATSRS
jgi:hypothetical protein